MQELEKLGTKDDTVRLALEALQYDSNTWRTWCTVGFDERQFHVEDLGTVLKDLPIRSRQVVRDPSFLHPITWLSVLDLRFLLGKLLPKMVDINTIPHESMLGSPLHAASSAGNFQVVEMLLASGVDINAHGGHALHDASRKGSIDIVHLLLQGGVNVSTHGEDFGNALEAACCGFNSHIVRLLIQEGAYVNFRGGLFGCALQAASFVGDLDIAHLLI